MWHRFGGDSASVGLTWLAIVFVYQLVLAFQTRKVKIKVVNDAKFIVAIIYISSLVFVVLIVVKFSLGSHINVREALFSGAILLATTAFVALIFIPKVSYSS